MQDVQPNHMPHQPTIKQLTEKNPDEKNLTATNRINIPKPNISSMGHGQVLLCRGAITPTPVRLPQNRPTKIPTKSASEK